MVELPSLGNADDLITWLLRWESAREEGVAMNLLHPILHAVPRITGRIYLSDWVSSNPWITVLDKSNPLKLSTQGPVQCAATKPDAGN